MSDREPQGKTTTHVHFTGGRWGVPTSGAHATARTTGGAGGASRNERSGNGLLAHLGGLVTRHTLIYIAGTLAVGPVGVISIVVMTRVLGPTKYGELGVLFVFAGLLTTLYNTGSLQGTFMWVYGTTEGEAGEEVGTGGEITSNHRRALGTGVMLTLAIVAAGTALCFALAPRLAALLHVHGAKGAALVRWAAISAATGSLWRLTVNVFRMERQPGRFAIFNSLRPVFVVATTIPLVGFGYGVQGVLGGTALGTLLASAACVAMAHRSYAMAFHWPDVREIVRRGSTVAVPVVCLYAVHNCDTVLISHFTSGPAVGTYRAATRFAVIPSYFASAFLMAWAPLERGVLFQAAYRHIGTERVRGAILTYYLLAGMTIVVLLDVAANGLTLLAGPAYRSAAPLIPLIGLGFVCYGLYIVLVRVVRVERTMLWFGIGAMLATGVQVALSSVTIPWLGAYGAPLATIAALLLACLAWGLAVTRLLKGTFCWQTRPLAGLGAAVAIATAVQGVGLSVWPAGRPLVLALVLASYAATILALGVVPRRHFGLLVRLARTAIRRRAAGEDPAAGLERLAGSQRRLLASLHRDGVPPAVLAQRLGRLERELSGEYVATLRELAGAPASLEPAGLDGRVADYLLCGHSQAQRDRMAHALMEDGIDPLELVELEQTAERLKALEPDRWRALVAEPHPLVAQPHRRQQRKRNPMPPRFADVAHDLRDHVIEHYERRGERLDTPAGLLTLDTNSVLAADRGRLLLRLLAEAGAGPVGGRRVLDVGAGFGALALYCAHLGAEVVAVDPNEQRVQVATAIARRRGLAVSATAARAQSLPFPNGSFDLAIANNSLCYIVDARERRAALEEIRRVLRPGGWLVMRNPNRLHVRDQFTSLPLLGLLPPSLARQGAAALRVHRSQVRLRSPAGAVRELRGAGFEHARWRPRPGRRFGARFAGYQHLLARRA